jgi:hypothetical protein
MGVFNVTTIANEIKVLVENKVDKAIKQILGPKSPKEWLKDYGWERQKIGGSQFFHSKHPGHTIVIFPKEVQHSFRDKKLATITHDNTEEYLRYFKAKKEGK